MIDKAKIRQDILKVLLVAQAWNEEYCFITCEDI